VIAPRHPERFAAVTEELRAMGADVHRLSAGPPQRSDQRPLLLLDRMGVLARSFGAADIALLGGSWNPIGGHNLLEPMAHGIPVLHGPHMHAQREIMRIAGPSGGCLGVPVGELGTALVDLAGDPLRRAKMGTAGRRAAQANRGAALRVVEAIEGYLANRERLSVRE
jgi:3-deoxy-D-manno-octulosonic-acid transferase